MKGRVDPKMKILSSFT